MRNDITKFCHTFENIHEIPKLHGKEGLTITNEAICKTVYF